MKKIAVFALAFLFAGSALASDAVVKKHKKHKKHKKAVAAVTTTTTTKSTSEKHETVKHSTGGVPKSSSTTTTK